MTAALRALAATLLLAGGAVAQTGEEILSELLEAQLDPDSSYRVRDLFLEREDIKFYFTDGSIIFVRPFRGRDIGALFLAQDSTDIGELLVIPPSPQERESVARHTGETVVHEKFRNALMLFTDDTAQQLRREIERNGSARHDAERGAALAKRWTPVLRNILEGLSLRMLADIVSDTPPEQGFFGAAIGGGKSGRFDVVVEPRADEQVIVGKSGQKDGRPSYEIWCRFEGRSFREGRRGRAPLDGRLENFRIDTQLDDKLEMTVRARATLATGTARSRSYTFELSDRLSVDELLIDGERADFVHLQQAASSESRRRDNNIILLLLPRRPEQGERFELEFRYSGRVISDAGNGVYFVGARGGWYPRAGLDFTTYEMTFLYPEHLDLTATGEEVESRVEDGRRFAHFRSGVPIRLAGFNLGRYVRSERVVRDGQKLEVLANRHVETRLEPRRQPMILMDPTFSRRSRGPSPPSSMVVSPTPVRTPRPADRIEQVTEKAAAAFDFFIEKFGLPPVQKVAITPIPGNFGQGFPGLVYASTLSYLDAADPPLKDVNEMEQLFYTELLLPHELSHQWWGNLVATDTGRNLWLTEALATYSALLWLEERSGRAALERVLEAYKGHLLKRDDSGEPVEKAGPVVMGERLRLSTSPNAYHVIVYEKGAWILHMLRGMMGDGAFFRFLRSLTDEFADQELTTEAFRRKASEHMPGDCPDRELRDFFEQWVYRSGLPRLAANWSFSGGDVRGTITQTGVPEHFTAPVTIEFQGLSGGAVRKTVWTGGERTDFSLRSPGKPTRVVLDPDNFLLAAKN